MIRKLHITICFLLIASTVTAQSWWNNKKVRGNGNVITEKRTTSNYDGISVGGSFDVILVKGKEGSLIIEGEENLIEYIETEVKRNTLQIKIAKGVNLRVTKKLIVTVSYADIDKVNLGGSGTIRNEGTIKANDFSVNLGGSGDIKLSVNAKEVRSSLSGSGNIKLMGSTNEFECAIAGSGNIKAHELETNNLNAVVTGSGNISTNVNNMIKAKVVGSGNIYYKEDPKFTNIKSVGSGNIKKKG